MTRRPPPLILTLIQLVASEINAYRRWVMLVFVFHLAIMMAKGKIRRAVWVHTGVNPLPVPHFRAVEMAWVWTEIKRASNINT